MNSADWTVMRTSTLALALVTSLFGGGAVAQSGPTVIELYTSQGCSSCPPADEMLTELAQNDDIIALALHVDYWDYIGWVDDLADPAYTKRQRALTNAAGERTIYTPQMVIDGVDHVIGSRPKEVMLQVEKHEQEVDPVVVSLSRNGDVLTIDATSTGLSGRAIVQVVRFTPSIVREIRRGENAGKTINYTNVVRSWETVGQWDVTQPLLLDIAMSGDDAVAVIVQNGPAGPILGAAQLR